MKKLFLLILLIVSLGLITACTNGAKKSTTKQGGGTTTTRQTDGTTTTKQTKTDFWDKDGNGIPDWQEKEITLRYATWQYNNPDTITIDVLLIEAFMEKYPNIKVEMQIVGEFYDWDTLFLGLLETDNLPDVFLIQRMGSFLPYNILADITDYFDNDPDTKYIFESVKNSGIYKGRRYAIPTFVYPNVWVVNLDLLDRAGINRPSYDWTVEQMTSIAKAVNDETRHIIGIFGCDWYHRIYPKVLKGKDSGWAEFGFDGNRFNFDDPVFQMALNSQRQAIEQGYCVPELSAEQLEEYYQDPAFTPTYQGMVGMWQEPTWSLKDYFDDMLFEWDIYPGPGGVTGGNTDIGGISALSEHKDAAYQLLKWMTFSEEGLLKRFELYDPELYVSGNNFPYPIVDYGIDAEGRNKIWESIPYGEVAPGFISPQFIESLKKGAIRLNKEVIGWDEVDGAVYNYFYEIRTGQNTYAALKDTIQQAADQAYQQAIEAMDERLGYR